MDGCNNCKGTICDEGLGCESLTMVCAPAARLGESCRNVECAQGLYCDLDDTCVDRTTAVTAPAASCASAGCPSGYYCEPNVYVCSAIGRAGDPCRGDQGCIPDDFCDCGTDFECNNPGVCKPKVALGQPCPAQSDKQCAVGYCANVNVAGTFQGQAPNFVCVPDDLPIQCFSTSGTTQK